MGYIVLPTQRDSEEVPEQGFEVVRAQFPSWTEDRADPMTLVLRAYGVMTGDLMDLAQRMGDEAFRYFGRSMAGLLPVDEQPATGTVTITAQDADGPYAVEEGLEFFGKSSEGEVVGFRTTAPGTVLNGDTTTVVPFEATDDGTIGNDATAPEFGEYVDYLTAIAFVAPPAGGRDREDDQVFLGRLREDLKLFTDTPILPADFATLARRFGAWRALAVKGYNPDDDTDGNPATIALAMVDAEGADLFASDAPAIVAIIDALREEDFVVRRLEVDYTDVALQAEGVALPGYDPALVGEAAEAAAVAYLSSARAGVRYDDRTSDGREWDAIEFVRYLEVAAMLDRVEGLDYLDPAALLIGEAGGALAAADLPVPGRAALTAVDPADVSVTITAP